MGAVSLRDAVSGLRLHPVPEGTEAHTVSPLCRAVERFGVPVPRAVLHACNIVSPAQLRGLRQAARAAEVGRMRDEQRRMRQEIAAIQAQAGDLWGRAAGVPREPPPAMVPDGANRQDSGPVRADRGRSRAENA